jgi:hypothetical protein
MNANNAEQDATVNSAYNPFPEPQTIPAGWDYSALMSQPEADSALDKDEEAES